MRDVDKIEQQAYRIAEAIAEARNAGFDEAYASLVSIGKEFGFGEFVPINEIDQRVIVGIRALRAERDALAERIAELSAALEGAQAEVEHWQDASGLESGGDPGGVTPEAMRRYWEGVERERDEARAEVERLRHDHSAVVSELLAQSGDLQDALEDARAEIERLCAAREGVEWHGYGGPAGERIAELEAALAEAQRAALDNARDVLEQTIELVGAQAEVERLRQALEQYADRGNWTSVGRKDPGDIWDGDGRGWEPAQRALAND